MPPPPNRCPACGPVAPDLSSRYCGWHVQELQASCLADSLDGWPPAPTVELPTSRRPPFGQAYRPSPSTAFA